MRKFLVPAVAVAAIALASPAGAQQKAQGQAPAGEMLLMLPPAGWQPAPVQKSDKVMITRLYPPGQNDKQWTEMITVQIYPGSDQSPRSFLDSVVTFSRANCEATGPGPVTEAPINNYPSAFSIVQCTKGKQSGKGNVVMINAIKGRDALYVVQRQWRGKPFSSSEKPEIPEAMLKEWTLFTRTVGLCDSRDKNHPCP